MNNDDNVKQTKFVENNAIIIVLFIILIILTPYVTSVIGTSWKKADESSTKGTIETVKLLYLSETVGGAYLPFKVEYNKSGYTMYSNNQKYTPLKMVKVDSEGQQPKSGSVTIEEDGTVSVKDLRYGLLKCNSDKNEKITCKL